MYFHKGKVMEFQKVLKEIINKTKNKVYGHQRAML